MSNVVWQHNNETRADQAYDDVDDVPNREERVRENEKFERNSANFCRTPTHYYHIVFGVKYFRTNLSYSNILRCDRARIYAVLWGV